MQRPPSSRLPILTNRPSYDWIERLQRLQQKWQALKLAPPERQRIIDWQDARFAGAVAALAATAGESCEAGRVAAALSAVRGAKELTPALLSQVAGALTSEPALRRREIVEGPGRHVRPEHLPLVVENACRWFTADSFRELHAAEQTAIAHLRLFDIQPFETGNLSGSLVAANLFALGAGLPPTAMQDAAAYRAALAQGLAMNTRDMVELMAEAMIAGLEGMIGRAG